jgi:ATP-dependent RNA helicase RhlE
MSRQELEDKQFYGLGIAPTLLERLDALGFVHPTPIQYKAIPIAMTGDDVIGIAQTGTGKTLAFSIPLLQQISAKGKTGLVLTPTRELAIQVEETLRKLASPLGLRTAIIIGGTPQHKQVRQLKARPHVIVATPGRLIDLMNQRHVKLDKVGVLVLDEADRMLDMGFAPQLKKVMAIIPAERQTLLFSATMPEEIAKIARQFMKKPLRVEVAPSGTAAEKVEQEVYIVPRSEKIDLLEKILQEYKGTVLVFSRTKYGAKNLAAKVRQMGHSSAEIHGNRSQNQRQIALSGFASGKYRVLVATDIAARGIDVKDIELVVNFDLPDQLEDYVHRIGRTGRAGSTGKAISFASPEQKKDVRAIERLIKKQLPVLNTGGDPVKREAPSGKEERYGSPRKRGGSGGRKGGRGGRSGGRRSGSTSGSGGGRRKRPGGRR